MLIGELLRQLLESKIKVIVDHVGHSQQLELLKD